MSGALPGYTAFHDRIRIRTFHPTRYDEAMLLESEQRDSQIESLTDDQFLVRAVQSRTNSELTSKQLIESVSLARHAIQRTLGLSPYRVQVLAGIAMARGGIAEMQTGEGKTLAGVFPAVIHALRGNGVHVATANAYLARRDFELLTPVFNCLGLTTGLSTQSQSVLDKKVAYQADVIFATGYQLGFDFLHDQLSLVSQRSPRLGATLRSQINSENVGETMTCQRGHLVAIIDEVDSVLIDEATTPLVLSSESASGAEGNQSVQCADRTASVLVRDRDFHLDEREKIIQLTESGKDRSLRERPSALGTFVARPWLAMVQASLRAHYVMQRDVDYVVRDGQVVIVDESTGRIFEDRQWRDGLHQAVEAKEGVPISGERKTDARISRQRYFQKYDLLCGMTGTADGHQPEWWSTYHLPVVQIPTRLPSQRMVAPNIYVPDQAIKRKLIAESVAERSAEGQPVLIGTRTIAQSRELSRTLVRAGINHQLLNGLQDEAEAELISRAGRAGMVTLSTNLAGRGTDILPDERAIAAGGLHVIGWEPNLSRRVDRQLLGRAGRQGQPGSGQFYVCGEDELVANHDPAFAKQLTRLTVPLHNAAFDKRIASLQRAFEQKRHQIRQQVMQQELWMNQLRSYVA